MRSRRGRRIALSIAGLAAAASATVAFADGSDRSTAEIEFTVPSDERAFGVAKCPDNDFVTGIGFKLGGPGTGFVDDLLLPSPHKATFAAGNDSGTRLQATTFALCRKRERLLNLNTGVKFTNPNHSALTVIEKTCPPGTSVTGGGVGLGGDGQVLQASYPSSERTWHAESYEAGAEKLPIIVYANCDPNHTYVIKSDSERAPSARSERAAHFSLSAEAKCRSDFSTTGGGFDTSSDEDPILSTSRPKGARSWLSQGRLSGDKRLTSYAVCRK